MGKFLKLKKKFENSQSFTHFLGKSTCFHRKGIFGEWPSDLEQYRV